MDMSEIARNIPQACRDAAADSPGLPAITDDMATVTFAELDALRRRVGRALLALGVAQFNLAFPGTISVRATTLMATVEDLVLSLTAQGFRHFYFVNGHGGNVAPVRAAFQDIYARWSLGERSGASPRCRLRSWWEYPAADALRRTLYGAAEGMHATPSEVAITRHCDPQAFAAQTEASDGATLLPPQPLSSAFLRDHGGDNHWDARSHREAFPDGRVGSDSGLARATDGAALLELAISGAVEDYRAFLAEE